MSTFEQNVVNVGLLDKDLQKRRRLLFLILLLLFILILLSGCRSSQPLAVAERTSRDTCYVNTVQYDSIYIDNWHYTYHRADTVFRDQIRYEYRYRLLHDTLRVHRVDSIPVVCKVEVVREVSRPLSWFDKVCRACFFVLLLVMIIGIVALIRGR